MKYYLIAVFTIAVSILIVAGKPSSKLDVRCEAEVLHTIEKDEDKLTLDIIASLFMMGDGKGFVNLYGTLTDHKELWQVNRKIWFDWRDELNGSLYDITIKRVDVKTEIDKAPESLMEKIYSHRFNLEIFRVAQNGLFLRGVSTPFFLCVRQNKIGKVT
ncbi:hypothetical protein FMK90_03735 [Klebsiella grimontii]|uniref:hypothetical protein n=1 Tax=Klebsiella grimontii TaxID=2058152 RepID=UPI0011E43CA6|nr:hypothetical protein [Klebsiella grimontii]MBZ7363943.1 hypothetical protein [Klebsiella grimontii]MBZ7397479.1 hypothetical protein [Klebsiella grimontii]MDU7344244.1 hypothetical protein [Klebsiella grimontii]MEB8267488.1 hypothetical protein [Klebsiella grimontii]TYF96509.1 hypothetical protein DJ542_00795 [Klebsiella grimontii]